MKKVFISQAMAGLSEEAILQQRNDAVKELKERYFREGVEIIDTYFDINPDKNKNIPLQYMALGIDKMAEANLCAFLKGWNTARGCRIEEAIANAYEIECIYL